MTWSTSTEVPDPEPEPEVAPPTARIRPYLRATLTDPAAASEADPEADSGPAAEPDPEPAPTGLRPFVLTAGRVSAVDPAIGLETQVTARDYDDCWTVPPVSRLSSELREIVALCVEPMSVAEISARLRLHLGVTRILVGDLRAAGHLDVHVRDAENAHDPELIRRVIDGLRAIS